MQNWCVQKQGPLPPLYQTLMADIETVYICVTFHFTVSVVIHMHSSFTVWSPVTVYTLYSLKMIPDKYVGVEMLEDQYFFFYFRLEI